MKTDIKTITDHLLFDFPRVQTDAKIILGMRSISGEVARHVASTHTKGQKILITGGLSIRQPFVGMLLIVSSIFGNTKPLPLKDFTDDQKESNHIYEILISRGINPDDIIQIDQRATNTAQNFNNAANCIQKHNIQSVTVVTGAYHQRRAIETLAKINPELTAFPEGVYPCGITKDNWHKTLIAGEVKNEFNKVDGRHLENYHDKGFCIPVDMDILKKKAKTFAPA